MVFEALGQNDELLDWMNDWRGREDVQPYMLLTLIEQHWRMNRKDIGYVIAREASVMPEAPDELQIWLALYEVQRQNWEAVDRCLKRVNACALLPFYQLLYQMVTEVAVSALSGSNYANSRAALAQIRKASRSKDKFLWQVYVDCQQKLAHVKGKTFWDVVYKVVGALS